MATSLIDPPNLANHGSARSLVHQPSKVGEPPRLPDLFLGHTLATVLLTVVSPLIAAFGAAAVRPSETKRRMPPVGKPSRMAPMREGRRWKVPFARLPPLPWSSHFEGSFPRPFSTRSTYSAVHSWTAWENQPESVEVNDALPEDKADQRRE